MTKFKVFYTNGTGETNQSVVIETEKTPAAAAKLVREIIEGARIVKVKRVKGGE